NRPSACGICAVKLGVAVTVQHALSTQRRRESAARLVRPAGARPISTTGRAASRLSLRLDDRTDSPGVQVEHHDCAGCVVVADELGADDAGRVEPEAVGVEAERSLEVAYGERDDVNPSFQSSL